MILARTHGQREPGRRGRQREGVEEGVSPERVEGVGDERGPHAVLRDQRLERRGGLSDRAVADHVAGLERGGQVVPDVFVFDDDVGSRTGFGDAKSHGNGSSFLLREYSSGGVGVVTPRGTG